MTVQLALTFAPPAPKPPETPLERLGAWFVGDLDCEPPEVLMLRAARLVAESHRRSVRALWGAR